MRIILNFDDLGYSKEANDDIFYFMAKGAVKSSSLIANGPAFEDAVRNIPSYPSCSFGVHLNVTEFKPLTSQEEFKHICKNDGSFAGNIRQVLLNHSLRKAIYFEWYSQIEKIESYGIKISHIDSHHNVHTIPSLFMTLKRLQKKFDIKKVRISYNIYSPSNYRSKLFLMKKRFWNFALIHFITTKGTRWFTDFVTFFELANTRKQWGGDVELMVHPKGQGHKNEFHLLESNWVKTINQEVKIISYNEL